MKGLGNARVERVARWLDEGRDEGTARRQFPAARAARACPAAMSIACSGAARCGSTAAGWTPPTGCRRATGCGFRRSGRAQRRRAGRPCARDPGFPVVFEDDALLVIDKPAGVAVHGGSGVSFGVIEQLRAARPESRFLELAHRLDRETSGLLIAGQEALGADRAARGAARGAGRQALSRAGEGTLDGAARATSMLPLRKYRDPGGRAARQRRARAGKSRAPRFELVRALRRIHPARRRELDTGPHAPDPGAARAPRLPDRRRRQVRRLRAQPGARAARAETHVPARRGARVRRIRSTGAALALSAPLPEPTCSAFSTR